MRHVFVFCFFLFIRVSASLAPYFAGKINMDSNLVRSDNIIYISYNIISVLRECVNCSVT